MLGIHSPLCKPPFLSTLTLAQGPNAPMLPSSTPESWTFLTPCSWSKSTSPMPYLLKACVRTTLQSDGFLPTMDHDHLLPPLFPWTKLIPFLAKGVLLQWAGETFDIRDHPLWSPRSTDDGKRILIISKYLLSPVLGSEGHTEIKNVFFFSLKDLYGGVIDSHLTTMW